MENKTSRYLKYAVGEIILVVIGILIALQINTWNENRKNQNYEQKILKIISQNLKNDSIAITEELNSLNESIRSTDKVLNRIDSGTSNDSLNIWLGKIISFERFNSQSSAFEVLKSKGIDVISDKDLQLELISYYDGNVNEVYVALMDVEESFKKVWEPLLVEEFSDFKWRTSAVPVKPQEFLEKQSTKNLLRLYRENKSSSIPFLESALQKISKINRLINNVIND